MSACVAALRRVAEYRLESPLDLRLQNLSERKEFLGDEEHAELMALLAFSQRRTIEKLEAQVALKQLGEILPEFVGAD
jgi:hypothetical protein